MITFFDRTTDLTRIEETVNACQHEDIELKWRTLADLCSDSLDIQSVELYHNGIAVVGRNVTFDSSEVKVHLNSLQVSDSGDYEVEVTFYGNSLASFIPRNSRNTIHLNVDTFEGRLSKSSHFIIKGE